MASIHYRVPDHPVSKVFLADTAVLDARFPCIQPVQFPLISSPSIFHAITLTILSTLGIHRERDRVIEKLGWARIELGYFGIIVVV